MTDMVDYGKVRSTVKPEPKVIDDFSVWINSDIHEVQIDDPDGENQHTEYEYNMVQYSKDEYINMIDNEKSQLQEELTDTQLALCDVYEMIGG
jgi:hypothetical protein